MPRPPSGPPVQVVWFKKDLRVRDHAPLARAAERGPVLPLYLYEPEQLHHEEFAGHHLTYLNDCFGELNGRLRALGTPLVLRRGEAVAVLEELSELVPIGGLWAHEETGGQRGELRAGPPGTGLGAGAWYPLHRAAAKRGGAKVA